MDSLDYVTHLRRDLDAFATYLDGDLSTPVRHCGDWTLHDLAGHLGRVGLWAASAITDKHGDYTPPSAPSDPADLAPWFKTASGTLLTALAADPSTEAWTFFPPHTVGFWQRRSCLEALVHRWDAEQALGIRHALDPAIAGDGVDEVVNNIAPGLVEQGRTPAPKHAVSLAATDTGSSWVLGRGSPVATIRATAPELLLLLWGRLSVQDPAFTWTGDRTAAAKVLQGPLVP